MSVAVAEFGGCVVDASVGAKLFIEDPLSAAAHVLFDQLTSEPSAKLYVPDLFYIEVANVLWKYVRWQGLPAVQAHEYAEALTLIALTSIPTAELMTDALRLATERSISAYDACYVALSQRVDCPLITCDKKLATALNQPDLVILLGEQR